MTSLQIVNLRLRNQKIEPGNSKNPEEIVSWLGAMQAQDYAMAKWALGIRMKDSTEQKIEQAIDSGAIIRTHILRPTWHLVSSKDIRWMMSLASPHMKRSMVASQKKLGLDEKIFLKSNKIIDKLLQKGDYLTRNEIMSELNRKGIFTNSLRAIHIMFRAEMDMVVCNGIRREKEFTYAHFDLRIPDMEPVRRDEAIAELAKRYFTSRSPATLNDFIWWSGLPAADAKLSIEMIKNKFKKLIRNGKEYWLNKSSIPVNAKTHSVHLLPAFDEFTVSYRNRSDILEKVFEKKAGNGIFFPVMLVDGRITGIWKRTIRNNKATISLYPFKPPGKEFIKSVGAAAERFGHFIGCDIEIIRKR